MRVKEWLSRFLKGFFKLPGNFCCMLKESNNCLAQSMTEQRNKNLDVEVSMKNLVPLITGPPPFRSNPYRSLRPPKGVMDSVVRKSYILITET